MKFMQWLTLKPWRHFSFHLDQNFYLKLLSFSYKFWKCILNIQSFEEKWFSGLHRCNEAMEFLFSGENQSSGRSLKEEMYSEIILSGWFNDYQGMQWEKTHKIYFFTLDGLVEQFNMRKQERVKNPCREFYSQKTYALLKTHCSTYQLVARACAAFSHLLVCILSMYMPMEPFGFALNRSVGEKYISIKEPLTYIISSCWWQIVYLYEQCQWQPEQTCLR